MAALKGAAHRDYGAVECPSNADIRQLLRRKERNGLFSHRTRSFVRYARENRLRKSKFDGHFAIPHGPRLFPSLLFLSVSLSLSAPPSIPPCFLYIVTKSFRMLPRLRTSRRVMLLVHVYEDERLRPHARDRKRTQFSARPATSLTLLLFLFPCFSLTVSSSIFQRFSCFPSLKLAGTRKRRNLKRDFAWRSSE